MSDLIVDPKPGVFTFVGKDGDDLRDVVMSLNDQWSFYMVRRVGDDAQLEGLEKTLEDVEENGVDRSTMVAVESLGIGQLHDYYPSSTYTLRRSNTNKQVALEEVSTRIKETLKGIYKFILGLLTKGLNYIKEKASAAKQKLKRDKAKTFDEMIKTGFNSSEYLGTQEIKSDPKLSSEAEALEENYNELLDLLINSGSFSSSFNTLVENVSEFTDPLVKKIEAINQGIRDIEAHNESAAYTAFTNIQKETPHASFSSFLYLLDVDKRLEGHKAVQEAQNKLTDLYSSQSTFNAYSLSRVHALVEKAIGKVGGETPMFVFDDEALDTALNAAIKQVDNIREQEGKVIASLGKDSQSTAKALRDALDVIYRDVATLTFIVNFADQFFTIIGRYVRNASLYLEHCKKK